MVEGLAQLTRIGEIQSVVDRLKRNIIHDIHDGDFTRAGLLHQLRQRESDDFFDASLDESHVRPRRALLSLSPLNGTYNSTHNNTYNNTYNSNTYNNIYNNTNGTTLDVNAPTGAPTLPAGQTIAGLKFTSALKCEQFTSERNCHATNPEMRCTWVGDSVDSTINFSKKMS